MSRTQALVPCRSPAKAIATVKTSNCRSIYYDLCATNKKRVHLVLSWDRSSKLGEPLDDGDCCLRNSTDGVSHRSASCPKLSTDALLTEGTSTKTADQLQPGQCAMPMPLLRQRLMLRFRLAGVGLECSMLLTHPFAGHDIF